MAPEHQRGLLFPGSSLTWQTSGSFPCPCLLCTPVRLHVAGRGEHSKTPLPIYMVLFLLRGYLGSSGFPGWSEGLPCFSARGL